ncbi:Alpha/Beta hydrolase protein [Radiomyces spectabilis]|uniref:Alpha/Beta hydrolase protein n=1 Tax=Radiomyces spectabilis TaxID=64574 RepID=UPI00221F9A21|nr:Alpha/Beta hydrolase protein [Radiomyces spectabilis]KAI8384460.1 Alpha/Beta hydrolase protein [Radiomyces spectabilis]
MQPRTPTATRPISWKDDFSISPLYTSSDLDPFGDKNDEIRRCISTPSSSVSLPTPALSGSTSDSSDLNTDESDKLLVKPDSTTHYVPRRVHRIQRHTSEHVALWLTYAVSSVLSLAVVLCFLPLALFQTAVRNHTDKNRRGSDHIPKNDQEWEETKEQITHDEAYYARHWGYSCEAYDITTQDGYVLRMYRINKKEADIKGKRAVLLGHGLFQCSGDFVLNEDKSLAFVLADQGYDVWLGNNRATATLDHTTLSHEDPEFWDWGIKELALYDFTAMIDHVRQATDSDKIAYIGHSQGNAQGFVALALQPEIATKLSCFIALAPAVFSGSLTSTFPIRLLINLDDRWYKLIFGTTAFLPLMMTAQKWLPPRPFSVLAYSMFAYLFSWWDRHWLRRRKVKYFQFTPRLVSSRLIADWLEGWGRRGVCLHLTGSNGSHADLKNRLPSEKVPLAVFYGSDDYLVSGERFIRTFAGYEKYDASGHFIPDPVTDHAENNLFPMLNLIHVERIPDYEHMDTIWGHDNLDTTYPGIFKVLSSSAQWDNKM